MTEAETKVILELLKEISISSLRIEKLLADVLCHISKAEADGNCSN